jgi:hypothetical protein
LPNTPKQVTRTEIEEHFSGAKGWSILEATPAEFITLSPRGNIPAIAACIEKTAE